MSDATTSINREIVEYTRKLATATNEFSEACRAFAEARTTYEVARAKATLRSNAKTAAERAAEAVLATEVEMRESRIAEATRDGLKVRVRSLEAALSAAQSRGASLRAAGRDY